MQRSGKRQAPLRFRGLRGRMTLVLAATMAVATVAVILVSRGFYLRSYAAIEDQEASRAMDRAIALLEDDIDQLDVVTRDWSSWDDAWDYMDRGDADFAASNLGEGTATGLGLSALAFLELDGSLRWAWSAAGEGVSYLLDSLALPAELPESFSRMGLAAGPAGIELVAARPILRSSGSGPVNGVIAMSRRLDAERLERYGRLLGLDLSLDPSESGVAPRPDKTDGDTISLPRELRGLDGSHLATLTLRMPRTLHDIGAATLVGNLVSMTIVLVLISLAAFQILESQVFRSLESIGAQLEGLASGKDPEARLSVPGGDELGALAEAMNRALDEVGRRLRERETMLREIHHRVKNNLQVIASLLNLQAAEGADASAREALLEGRRRVLAMALVHDELYDDPDLASIALDAFIDRFVAGFDPEDAPPTIVRKIVRVEPWPLDIEKAVPLGLILSEALSNAYRHAFSAGIAGKIEVEARRGSDGGLVVEVADNGKGLPPPASLRRGLGLALIDALASQLGGKAEILGREEGGTLVRLSMPPSPSSPAPSPGACP